MSGKGKAGISGVAGQSLVEMLLGIGLVAMISLVMSSMLFEAHREARAISEKLATLDLEKLLITSMTDGAVCKHVLTNPAPLTFNSTNLPQTITLPEPSPGVKPALYASILSGPTPGPVVAQVGSPVSVSAPALLVSSIQLQVLSGSGGTYRAQWLINIDDTTSVRPLKPVSVTTLLSVDDVTDPTNATVRSCSGGAAGAAGVTQLPYYKMYWDLTNTCQTTPSAIVKSVSGTMPAMGELYLNFYGRPFLSTLFEIRVRAPAPTTVTQHLYYVDDQVYFWLNGTQIDAVAGAGYWNRTITWNLSAGVNLIQIVTNDCYIFAGHEGVGIIGDFFSRNPELEFVP